MTKFSDEICKEICTNYENGMPIKWAAYYSDVDYSTVARWVREGKKAKSGKKKKFFLDMKKAKAKFIAFHLNELNGSDKDETHKYLLAVTDPEHFNLKNKLEHSGNVTNVNMNKDIDEDLLDKIIAEKEGKSEDKDLDSIFTDEEIVDE